MSEENNKKPSIFKKIADTTEALLDAQIYKAKTSMVMNQVPEDDFLWSKAITEDPSYAIHANGWKDKPSRLQDGHLKQMSYRNTVTAAVIQTRQNQVSAHSKLVKSEQETGWMLKLRDEDKLLEEYRETIRQEWEAEKKAKEEEEAAKLQAQDDQMMETAEAGEQTQIEKSLGDEAKTEDEERLEDQEFDWNLEREAKRRLYEDFKEEIRIAQDYILKCGRTNGRPFETLKWDFDATLRAWVRDSLTYDRYGTEVVPDRAGRPHHWFPIDGGTIKFASNQLKNYKAIAENFINLDILYPEKKAEAIEKQKMLDLDDQLLEKDMYKYVQVVRGKIERAYTADEMKVGIRNANTDIYNNGYGISELELAVSLVTGHLNAEFYNQAYFTQGFSAKGILHIKSQINRRKMETVRQQWQHMLKGARNSFQTPIFAGVDDVSWIPLTQRHEDIGFEGWMRYLIKMICAIYQIDPHEIGIGFKDEGSGGSLSTGDSTKEKMKASKDKGLYPLLRHIEAYINENILRPHDDRFVLCFTGVTGEDKAQTLNRQKEESKFKKTVNEIRAEDGLPPIPGMDNVILGPEAIQWYMKFSKEAKQMQKEMMEQQVGQNQFTGAGDGGMDEESIYNDDTLDSNMISPEPAEDDTSMEKSMKKKVRQVKVDVYRIED